MYKVYLMVAVLMLTGCDVSPEWRDAAVNYAEGTCEGKLLGDIRLEIPAGSISSKFFWSCIEDAGVVQYDNTFNMIPLKYWTGKE